MNPELEIWPNRPWGLAGPILLALLLVGGLGAENLTAGDWPQLMGPDRDGRYAGEAIRTDWGTEGPSILWSIELGEGFAGPVAVDGTVFVAHRLGDQNLLDALRLSDGSRLWRAAHPAEYRDDFGFNGGPRATPVVDRERVFSLGADGVLQAVDRQTGRKLWRVDTRKVFGVEKGFFGVASSPLVVGDRLLVNVGGPEGAGVVALDVLSGATVWKTSDHEASYSSPRLASIHGSSRAVFFTSEGLLVVDPDSGAITTEFRWRARIKASVNAATPVVVGDRIFLSSSYGTGAVLLRVGKESLEEIWRSDQSLTNHYATSVYHDGFLYGFHGRQESGPSLRCVRLSTGEVMWSEDRFGAGTLLIAQDRLLILRETGELVSAPASPNGFSPTAWASILDRGTRAYPALSDGVLLARDDRRLVAVDLRPGR